MRDVQDIKHIKQEEMSSSPDWGCGNGQPTAYEVRKKRPRNSEKQKNKTNWFQFKARNDMKKKNNKFNHF